MFTSYRPAIADAIRSLVRPLGRLGTVLDFGAGDGFFAAQWRRDGLADSVVAVDVVRRRKSLVSPILYDGDILPFADGAFDLAYAIDVLHHCPRPEKSLAELSRCSRRYLLLKDHVHRTRAGSLTLTILDELGNRRFGIPSPRHYQKNWAWIELLESSGWRRIALVHPMPCHRGVLGALTNRLQFIGLWERDHA